MKKVSFQNSDGLNLVGVWSFPKSKSSKVIILAHGITVDKDEGGVFVSLAKFLSEHGYVVFRFDFRGSGESDGKSVDMTVAGEVIDLKSAVEYVKDEGYQEIGLLAASFGGSIASFYAAKNESSIKALSLWNPVLNYGNTFVTPFLPWIKEKVGHMSEELQAKGWTTLGSRKFVIGMNLWRNFETLKPYEELQQISLPTIIIHATGDTYVPYVDSKEYISLLQNGKLITIKGGEHGFHGKENGEEKAQTETLAFFKKYL